MPQRAALTEEEIAHAYALLPEHNGNVSAVARELGTTHTTLNRSFARTPPAMLAASSQDKKSEIATAMSGLLNKLLARYESIIDQADWDNKGVILAGILADKLLLYSGLPNAITASYNVNVHAATEAARTLASIDSLSDEQRNAEWALTPFASEFTDWRLLLAGEQATESEALQ